MTKAHIEDISSTKKKLRLEVPASIVKDAYAESYKNIRKKAQIKGFRKGHVPDHVLDQFYGPDIEMESLNILVRNTWPQVVQEHQLIPVLEPHFDVKPLQRGQDYNYEVTLEVRPQVELKQYLEIPLKKKEAQVTNEDLQAELKKVQESRAELKPAEEGATLSSGLTATIDFEGTINKEPIQGGSAKGYVLEYGKGNFLKELEDKMDGMKIGEERIMDIIFPADYFEKSLQGQQACFRIKLLGLHHKELPAIDDDLAKDLGLENLETLHKQVEEVIRSRKEQSFRGEYASQLTEELLKQHQVDIPEGLMEQEIKQAKKTREEVEKSIKLQFILETIAEKESIKVENKDFESRFKHLSYMMRQPMDVVIKYYREKNLLPQLANQILIEKTIDFLIDKAKLES